MKRSERRYKEYLLKRPRLEYLKRKTLERTFVHSKKHYVPISELTRYVMTDNRYFFRPKKHGYCRDKFCGWCSDNRTYQARKEKERLAYEEYYYLGGGERLDYRKHDDCYYYNYFLPVDFEESYFKEITKTYGI